MNNAELVGGMAWLLAGVFTVWAGLDLRVGTLDAPGSGFLLFWVGLLMCGFSLSIMAGGVRRGGATIASLWAGTRWTKVAIVIASLAVYAVLFERLGYLLATLPLMLVLLRAVDPVRWTVAVPVAAVATIGSWWVLKRLLLIQLPSGMFEIG
jgi:putative tricarboxylic transport membrane protein